MGRAERWLRILAFAIGGYHLALGAGLTLSVTFQTWAVELYGAQVAWTATTVYFIRTIGTFALALGLALLAVAPHPRRHLGVIVSIAAFFLVRSIVRHVHAGELATGFSVAPVTNALTSGFFVVQALALLWLAWLVRRDAALPQPPR